MNKDTQTPGGTKGFSLKPGAVYRYYLNAEYRGMFLRQLREMRGLGGSRLNHPDLQQSRILKDESDVQSLIDLAENSWINPFREEQDSFVNLATGTLAPIAIANDLLHAHTVGEEAYQKFKTSRLEKDQSDAVDFYAKMKKQKLKTFSNIATKKVKCKGKDIILKADRNLFGHMIVIAQGLKLDMREVLSQPLGPIPWALANGDGSLRKTDKTRLRNEIGKNVPPAENLSERSASNIDGMSIIQKLDGDNKTFSELAKSALKHVLREGDQNNRIDVVFDVYLASSIKNAERCNRDSGSGVRFKSIASGHKIKQWRSFLSEAQNKTSLIQFLTEEWTLACYKQIIGYKDLYVTNGEDCWKITSDECHKVVELSSTQEEADTWNLLHVKHAADEGYKTVIVICEDTDVFVLCIAFAKDMSCSLYQKCGTQARTQYMNITDIRMYLGGGISEALVGLHAFTGCDTVSAFAGREKWVPWVDRRNMNIC